MSRTYRKNRSYFRHPQIANEKRQIATLLSEECNVSGINRLKSRMNLPDFEVNNSAYYQEDYNILNND